MGRRRNEDFDAGELQEIQQIQQMQKQGDCPMTNAQINNHTMSVFALGQQKVDVHSPKEVGQRIEDYLSLCSDDNIMPTKAGLALALGTSSSNLAHMVSGTVAVDRPVRELLVAAYQMFEVGTVNYMMNAKNPIPSMFLLKANFGYSENNTVTVKFDNPLGEQKSMAELEEKYRGAVVAEPARKQGRKRGRKSSEAKGAESDDAVGSEEDADEDWTGQKGGVG